VVSEAEKGIVENANLFRAIAPPGAVYQKISR
jgi:hypothetical protein